MLIAVAKRVKRDVRVLARLVRLERDTYAGALHPSMWRRGFLSSRMYSYPGIQDRSVPYINDVRIHALSSTLNSASGALLVKHKNVFADALAARGLESCAPDVYGVVTAEGFRPRSPQAGARLRAQQAVVLKPTEGVGGRGVRIVPGLEVEGMVAAPGTALLVQEQVVQHPALRHINPGSLNTVRVLAVRLPGEGPVLAAAVHRWGTAASGPVDNISSGGLWSRVDVLTGRLAPATGHSRARQRVEHHRHPDTGAQITGVLVPCWQEVRDLALRLMAAFPELDHVGWDIAVTPRGPLVIEGNGGMPALSIFQFHGPFLSDQRLLEYYVSRGMLTPA